MIDFQDLIQDHDLIDHLAAELEDAVSLDMSPQPSVDLLLDRLARVVASHLAKEDSFIYPGLVGSKDPADATSLIVEFDVIKRDWETYLLAWRDGAAACDWPAFRVATLGMLSRLRDERR